MGGKVTLPVLGDQYGKVLEAGELELQFDAALGTFHIAYYAERFPIAVRRYPPLLHSTANLLDRSGAPLFELADRFAALFADDAAPRRGRAPAGGVRAQGGAGRGTRDPPCAIALGPRRTARSDCRRVLPGAARAAGGPGLPARLLAGRELRDQLPALFDINQLAGLRMEQGEVFEATHRLLRLIAEGKVQGVRLDHIDGMYDPRGYCQRLLSRAADVLAEGRTAHSP